MKKLPNIHPGEVLLEEFLIPMEISQNALARATRVPPRRINEIVLGKRGITADTALRLAAFFGTSEGLWLGLQADYDLEEARGSIAKGMAARRAGEVGVPRREAVTRTGPDSPRPELPPPPPQLPGGDQQRCAPPVHPGSTP